MSDYYVFRDEKPDGPHTKSNLIELVAAGKALRSEPCMSASKPEVQTVEDAINQPEHIVFGSLDKMRAQTSAQWQSSGEKFAEWLRDNAPASRPAKPRAMKPKPMLTRNRGIYIILGLLFGSGGFHNFYAGRHKAGFGQLALSFIGSVLLFIAQILGIVVLLSVWVWAITDIITITEDADGNPMA
jgi:TM2 domain-containing membrane protein YozV